MTDLAEIDRREPSAFKRWLGTTIAATMIIGGCGALAGFTAKASRAGLSSGSMAGLALILVFIVAGIWLLRRSMSGLKLAKTPRRREYQLIMLATVGLGAVIGAGLQMSAPAGVRGLASLNYDAPMNPVMAMIALAVMPLLGILFYRWHRTADEHETAAYDFGGILALYAYFFASTGWWFAWKGGFTGEPDGFLIFFFVMIVWSLGWMWRRYR